MAWITWRARVGLLEGLAATLLAFSVVWCFACTVGGSFSYEKLNPRPSKLLLWGPRPQDTNELRVWKWAQAFKWGIVSVVVFMILRAALVELRLR
jgi:hypothetical protein